MDTIKRVKGITNNKNNRHNSAPKKVTECDTIKKGSMPKFNKYKLNRSLFIYFNYFQLTYN